MSLIYLKFTNQKTGKCWIEGRQCWDRDRFLASIIKQYAENEKNPATVQLADRADYLESIKKTPKDSSP